MKLLVITQAVDQDELVLGFFHRWLEVFSTKFSSIEAVCLKEGVHALPANVCVRTLGKPATRAAYILNFYKFAFSLQYDAVFVHMNEEYVLLGGLLWRLMGKKIVLWRNHKMGSWRTRLAVALSHTVCYTSPEAFVARYPKAVRMPIGVDTDLFTPPSAPPSADSVLFLGRLDPVKKVDVFVDALKLLSSKAQADIYGSPTDPSSAYAKALAAKITLHSGVPHAQTPALYRSHALYVNLTPSGSFDKTIGEAMASGCVVVCANEALRGILPDSLLITKGDAPSAAHAIDVALAMAPQEREALSQKLQAFVAKEHSLAILSTRLLQCYEPTT
jgi:glycosyltransferase involved in cell wall biosynthesis